MPTISQLSVKINVDASGLSAGLSSATQQVSVFANQTTNATIVTNKFAAATNETAQAIKNATAEVRLQIAQQSLLEQQTRACEAAARKMGQQFAFVGQEMARAGRDMTLAGAGILGAIGAMVKVGANLDSTMTKAVNNTTLAGAAVDQFKSSVMALGANMAAPFSQIADGMMHVSNLGFSVADSQKVMAVAMKSAIATGADAGKTGELLGGFMHQAGLGVKDAGNAMNFLHTMGAQGNLTMQQFNTIGLRMFAVARGAGTSVTETAAAFAALTRNGFTAAQAGTQVAGMINKIGHPANNAVAYAQMLDEKLRAIGVTSIHLTGDLTSQGLSAKGLLGIMNEINIASRDLGLNPGGVASRLIPAMRGGQGAAALAGFANKDMNSIGNNKAALVDAQYAEAQKKLNVQLQLFKNNIEIISQEVETVLLPPLNKLLGWAMAGLRVFESLPAPVKTIGVVLAVAAGAALALAGPLLTIGGGLVTMAGAAAAAGVSLGAVAAAALPFVAVAALVVAAIVGIGIAFYTNFGGIRTEAVKFVNTIKPYLTQFWNGLLTEVSVCWNNIQGVISGALQIIKGVLFGGFAIIAGIVSVTLAVISGDWRGAWERWIYFAQMGDRATVEVFKGMFNTLKNLFIINDEVMVSAGLHLMQSLENGIYNGGVGVINAAKSVVNDMLAVVSKATGLSIAPIGMTTRTDVRYADNYDAVKSFQSSQSSFSNPFSGIGAMGSNFAARMSAGMGSGGFREPSIAGGGDGGSPGKKGRKGREDHTASDLASAIASVQDKLFDATHTDQMIKIKDAYKEYLDNLKTGVPLQLAEQLYYSQFGKIIKDSADEANKALATTAAAAAAAAAKVVDLNRKIADTLYNKTHSQSEIGKRDNYQNFLSNIVGGASPALANSLYSATNKQIDEDDAQKKKDKMDKFVAELVKGIEHWNKAVATEAAKVSENTRSFYSRLTEETSRASTNLLAVTDPMKAKWLDFLQGFSDRLGGMTGGTLIKAMADLKAAFAKINEDNGMADSLRKKKEQIQGFADDTKSILAGAFEGLFQSGIKGFFSKVLSGFTSMFQQIAAQAMAGAATRGLMSLFSGILGGGTAGIAGGGGGGGFAMSFGDSLTGLATGGGVDAGRTYMVGEKGPELFRSSSAGSITSNSDLSRAIGSGGGGNVYHLHIHDAKDTQSIKNSSRQILNSLSQQIDQNAARNGRR